MKFMKCAYTSNHKIISTVRCSIPPTTRIPIQSNPSVRPLIGLGVLNHSNAIEID